MKLFTLLYLWLILLFADIQYRFAKYNPTTPGEQEQIIREAVWQSMQ